MATSEESNNQTLVISESFNVEMVNEREVIEEETNEGKESDGENEMEYTRDGSRDWLGKQALKARTGGWKAGMLLLGSHGLATLAFVGVEVNLVLFSTRVLNQTNAEAANTFSRWMGTVNLFSLLGGFLSDSYLGRYKTCFLFQIILLLGLALLSLTTYFFLKPVGCGIVNLTCDPHSPLQVAMFYISLYMIALGNGGYEPALATFGSDQFDEEDEDEKKSKFSFYSYFYVATNIGSLFSETILAYLEDSGKWVLSYWISTASGLLAFMFLLSGLLRYRNFTPSGNPFSRFCQVIMAAGKKLKVSFPLNGDKLYEVNGAVSPNNGSRKILHTEDFRFLDRAAIITEEDEGLLIASESGTYNPWCLCTITQVEEVKCVLRLLPIWFCTIFYSVVFIQVLSLFLEQGASMNDAMGSFHMPPASMTVFDIVSISLFIVSYNKLVAPLYTKITKIKPKEPSELQRMGIGFLIAIIALGAAAMVEVKRLKYAKSSNGPLSSLSIFWQVPQYVLIGVSEAFMYVGQMEFFGSQTPDALKSLGMALSMSSVSIGSYLCSLLLTVTMKVTTKGGRPGWIPANLNQGHMDKFFLLLAGITVVDLGVFIWCARRYKCIIMEERSDAREAEDTTA